MLTCSELSFAYTNKQILNKINFSFKKAKLYLLTGPSGSGKTTFIKCLAGLMPYQGTITLDNVDLANISNISRSKLCGIVFQEYNLFPHLTVLKNCISSLITVDKISAAKAEKIATDYLKKLNIAELAHQYPSALSGGQKQRVAIVRSLVKNVKVLILDEPTAAIDEQAKIELVEILYQLQKNGITLIISSHDPFLVNTLKSACNIRLINGELNILSNNTSK